MKKELLDAEIPGFEGYSVRNDGTVLGKHKRPLKPYTDRDGYQVVSLLQDGKTSKRFIHRLVAQAYIPNPDNKTTVNHKNGIKSDNRVENLEWATQSENNTHAYRTQLAQPHRMTGTRNGRAKLRADEISAIRAAFAQNPDSDIQQIASKFGVSKRIIANIRDNKTYKTSLQ